ncbi:hypothetical protein CLOSTHATH_03738 [Hungatella hathewayi DSM 13479]|uniref:Uncharacterized protein n=1 Tax=Hungatella hathewayi DSM 13479 TaxID=566550 RepID=D3AJE7_9FIRM|nr:hypothetical protein CLOSTHATH_03738 [Hungatella hathewayi DSM 13479]
MDSGNRKSPVPEYSYIFRDGALIIIRSRGTTRFEILYFYLHSFT